MTDQEMRQKLMDIAQLVADNSNGRIRMAYQEQDATTDVHPEAAHFLKVDGARFGADIEMYGFLGECIMGWQETLVRFLEEIILPLNSLEFATAYKVGGEELRLMGHNVYPSELLAAWDALF